MEDLHPFVYSVTQELDRKPHWNYNERAKSLLTKSECVSELFDGEHCLTFL